MTAVADKNTPAEQKPRHGGYRRLMLDNDGNGIAIDFRRAKDIRGDYLKVTRVVQFLDSKPIATYDQTTGFTSPRQLREIATTFKRAVTRETQAIEDSVQFSGAIQHLEMSVL
jgi:hypothetical protein